MKRATDQDLARVSRTAGLKRPGPVDLAVIERRRLQVWGTMAVLLLGLSLTLVLTSLWPDLESPVLDPTTLRMAMVVLSAAFTAYVFEKERALGRLTRLVLGERDMRVRLDAQSRRLHGLLEEIQAMGAALDLDRLVQVVLGCTIDLCGEGGAAMTLGQPDGQPLAHARNLNPRDAAAAGRLAREAAATGETVVRKGASGDAHAIAVPMRAVGKIVGVLAVFLPEAPSEGTISTVEAFTSHAATALSHARRYVESRLDGEAALRAASAWDELDALLQASPPAV